jgi:hypothetical protein
MLRVKKFPKNTGIKKLSTNYSTVTTVHIWHSNYKQNMHFVAPFVLHNFPS